MASRLLLDVASSGTQLRVHHVEVTYAPCGCGSAVGLVRRAPGCHATRSAGPPRLAPLVLIGVLTPVALRVFRLGKTYRQMFSTCFIVGLVVGLAFLGRLLWQTKGASSIQDYVLLAVFLLVCVFFGSALAAAAAWKPAKGAASKPYQLALAVLQAGSVFVVFELAVRAWTVRDVPGLVQAMGWAVFLGLFFLAVASTVHLPLILSARRLLSRPLSAVLGAMLFPVPLLGLPLLQGRVFSYWAYLMAHPGELALAIVPCSVAGAVLGALLSGPTGPPPSFEPPLDAATSRT